MSINYKKISQLISDEINQRDLTREQKESLIKTCENIYRIESSIQSVGTSKIMDEIISEVSYISDKFNVEE
jgi:hypothetical protein